MKIAFIHGGDGEDNSDYRVIKKNEKLASLTSKLIEELSTLGVETVEEEGSAEVLFFCIPCTCCHHFYHSLSRLSLMTPIVILNISPDGEKINMFGAVQVPTAENIAKAATEALILKADLLKEFNSKYYC
jgi:hypothetical protein